MDMKIILCKIQCVGISFKEEFSVQCVRIIAEKKLGIEGGRKLANQANRQKQIRQTFKNKENFKLQFSVKVEDKVKDVMKSRRRMRSKPHSCVSDNVASDVEV